MITFSAVSNKLARTSLLIFSLTLGQALSLMFSKVAFSGTTTTTLAPGSPAYALRCGSMVGELRPYGRMYVKWNAVTSGQPPYIVPEFTGDITLTRYSISSGYYEEVGYDYNVASGYSNSLLVEAK
jgi:hypothetical protein